MDPEIRFGCFSFPLEADLIQHFFLSVEYLQNVGQSKADAGERDSLRPVGAFAVRHTVGAALARRCHILVAALLDVCAMEIDVDKMVLLL